MTLREVNLQEPGEFGPVPARGPTKPKVTQGTKKPSGSQRSLQTDIAALLVQGNLMFAGILKGDVMDDLEIMALAKAVDEQAKKSPRFRAVVQRALTVSGGTGLISITVIILARRASRHGLIDPMYDAGLGGYLALTQMSPSQQMAQLEAAMAAQVEAMTSAAAQGPTPTEPGSNGTEAPRPE